jgi:DNA-directed RNA polymerase subunit omega
LKRISGEHLNAELLRKAAERVGNPNILINLVSRRVRQLNAQGGAGSRPLLANTAGMGAADIALSELIEDKMAWERIEGFESESEPARKRRRG